MTPKVAFGGGVTESNLHPAVLAAMIIAILLIMVLPRRHVMAPILLGILLIPNGQQIYAGGIHWLVFRVIILFGLLRIALMKSEKILLTGGFSPIDRAFLGCMLCQALAFVITYKGDAQSLVYQVGFLIDFVGGYFVMRVLIEDEDGCYRALKWLALLTVIFAITMAREQQALQNVFGLLGGVRAVPEIREGKIRSQAAFQHSLTAGTFGASLLPLFFLLWKNGRAKAAAVAGMVGCSLMTVFSNGSTPLLTYVAGLLGVCLWPIRKSMRSVRWCLVISLVCLHLVMKAPVWFVIAHIDLTGGSSGYHRAELVDQFIRHFSDWWLIGTKDAATWAYDMWDQQNQYVNVGETGGLLALVLFITFVSRACGRLGDARKLVEGQSGEWTMWLLGASLFANLVGFFGVDSFDQSRMGWLTLFAMIIVATTTIFRGQTVVGLVTRDTDLELVHPNSYVEAKNALAHFGNDWQLCPPSHINWHDVALRGVSGKRAKPDGDE